MVAYQLIFACFFQRCVTFNMPENLMKTKTKEHKKGKKKTNKHKTCRLKITKNFSG